MDGSEILSLLESARKPTEFIGGVSSTTQSWVQVAVSSSPSLVFLNVPHLLCFVNQWQVCVCVLHPSDLAFLHLKRCPQ